MAFNGSGTHNRVHDWTQDLTSTIPVTASRMDAEHDDISSSLSNTICRDGQSTTTARIPFASGVSCAAGSTSSVAYAQANDPNTGLYFPATDQWGLVAGGAATLAGTSSGVSVSGTLSASGSLSVTGAATLSSTLAVSGDITQHGQLIVPIGTVLDYAGGAAPNGWLLCFGQAVSRTTYASLFALLSTNFGAGDGSTTFNLPDLRGRVVAGKDDMGGTSANRLTNQSGGLNGDLLGATGGAETHTLTTGESGQKAISAAPVSITDPGHVHAEGDANEQSRTPVTTDGVPQTGYWGGSPTNTGSATTGITAALTLAGSSAVSAHNNVQPTIILNKIIYTNVYS